MLTTVERPPGPKGLPGLGSFFDVSQDALGFLEGVWKEWGDTSRFTLGPYDLWMIVHPKDVLHVMVSNGKNYEKSRLYENLKPVLGDGVISAAGERWVQHRKLLQPMFARSVVEGVVAKVASNAEQMVEQWEGEIDLGAEMSAHALRNIGDVLLGEPLQDARVTHGLPFVLGETHRRIYQLAKWPLWVPVPRNRAYNAALRGLHAFVDELIEARLDRPPEDDVAGLLVGAVASGRISLEDARAEITTMVMAGHETAGLTMTWFWSLMARHPEWHARLVAEARGLEQPVETLGSELGDSLPLLRMCLLETLRLYPPTWWLGRAPLAPDVVGGFEAQPGQVVSICSPLTHRHPDFWDEPDLFRPERFEAGTPRDGSYIPFALGPRACPGRQIAMLEMLASIAVVLRRVEVRIEYDDWRPEGRIQLRPSRRVRAHRRRT